MEAMLVTLIAPTSGIVESKGGILLPEGTIRAKEVHAVPKVALAYPASGLLYLVCRTATKGARIRATTAIEVNGVALALVNIPVNRPHGPPRSIVMIAVGALAAPLGALTTEGIGMIGRTASAITLPANTMNLSMATAIATVTVTVTGSWL